MFAFDSDEHIGEKFGKLTIIKYVSRRETYDGKRKRSQQMYMCKCDCGRTKITSYEYLKSGNLVTCGHCKTDKWLGLRFGKLVVTEVVQKAHVDETGKIFNTKLKVHCDCGKDIIVFASALRNKSCPKVDCGCGKKERMANKQKS